MNHHIGVLADLARHTEAGRGNFEYDRAPHALLYSAAETQADLAK